jgi:hypothetical protein
LDAKSPLSVSGTVSGTPGGPVGPARAGADRVVREAETSLLVAAGAHPTAIQRHLGHASIQTTLNIYGHLMPDEQDKVASALDDLRADTACPTDVPDDEDEAEG